MTRLLKLVLILLVTSLLLIFGGCAPETDNGVENGENGEKVSKTSISIASGGTGGAYYPLCGGIAELLTQSIEGFQATAEVTGAAVENMRLLTSGEAEIAIMDASIAFMAATGQPPFEDQSINVKSLGNISFSVGHFVALADTGIDKIEKVKGKKIAVGAPGSGTEAVTKVSFEVHGVTYEEFDVHYLTFAEAVEAMKDRQIDGATVCAAVPTTAILELTATHDIVFMELSQAEKVIEMLPFLIPWTIKADTYPGVDYDVFTYASTSFMAVTPDFDEELAYQITRTIFENLDYLKTAHPSAEDITPERAIILPDAIQLHPGAERYFKEIGVLE